MRSRQLFNNPEFDFWKVQEELWGDRSPVHRNPWSEAMIDSLARNRVVGIAGCASSGKTHVAAAYAVAQQLWMPESTAVLAVTGAQTVKARELFQSALRMWPHGVSTSMKEQGRLCLDEDNSFWGIHSFGGLSSIGAVLGVTAPRVLMIVDDAHSVSYRFAEAYFHNVAVNPSSQFLVMGNPKGLQDCLATACRPNGISVSAERWNIADGEVLHFDAFLSPGRDNPARYGYLPTRRWINDITLDPQSPAYWSIVRGFWAPSVMKEL